MITRVCLDLFLIVSLHGISAALDAPPPTREQVETDWLRQDAKRLSPVSANTGNVTREADAAGAVDGIKDGKWGFHTENEPDPWWQVDLQQPTKLDRVVLWNRCDLAERNSRILVLLSDDGKSFRKVYQHTGTVFYGFTDQKPLVVKLDGSAARVLRLALAGKSYFHLDEVEVYPAGEERNIALGKPATQSSTSQWSVKHDKPQPETVREYPIVTILERGLKLAESQQRLGARVDEPIKELRDVAAEAQALFGSAFPEIETVHRKLVEFPLSINLPLGTVGTRSTASLTSPEKLGTRWNASLPGSGAQGASEFRGVLTPPLSPGVEENSSSRRDNTKPLDSFPAEPPDLPLPDGERRGEGEASARNPRTPNAVNHSSTAPNSDDGKRASYFRARWAVRKMALANPLLNFDTLLFVKRAPTMFPHMSDQHYGWWSRGGGGIYVLAGLQTVGQASRLSGNKPRQQTIPQSPNQQRAPTAGRTGETPVRLASDDSQARIRCLTADMPAGNFVGPDISYDGKKVLFAYARFHPELHNEKNKADKTNVPENAFYHVFEMNVNGSGRRQLTHGKYDDFDPRWLPNGDILFLSTRKGLTLQCTKTFSDSTRNADLPDSYVRCGGDNWRPVPVFTLHAMDARGENLRPLSAFENFEWTPSVASDGRILYTRWDYIDRFNGNFFSLWSANQDGTNPQLVYGNYTAQPQVKFEARSIPGSSKLVITAGAHHSITGGALCLLDRTKGTELDAPITRLTPEVCFPETGGWPEHYYANPWPLSEEYFFVGWADAKLPPHRFVVDESNPTNAMGLYLYDAFGNQELLYRDPDISSMYPIPVAPRPKPPVRATIAEWDGAQEGRFAVQDVYRGLDGVARGTVKQLRIVGVPPKVQPHMNNPVLGVSAEDPGKFVLGTVPVEADGSAYFRAPSGVPVFFQALDEKGLAVQTMRSLTYVMPNQTLACVGCHEHRDAAPAVAQPMLASRREPSKLTPGPSGSWPLRFDQLIQPVLDQHCVECHRPGSKDAEAAKLDLSTTRAYQALMTFGGEDLKKQAFERDRSVAGHGTAANSKLWSLLTAGDGHKDVTLDADSLNRFATWMDTYAQRAGHFSEQQGRQLEEFRSELARTLQEYKPATH